MNKILTITVAFISSIISYFFLQQIENVQDKFFNLNAFNNMCISRNPFFSSHILPYLFFLRACLASSNECDGIVVDLVFKKRPTVYFQDFVGDNVCLRLLSSIDAQKQLNNTMEKCWKICAILRLLITVF